MSFLITPAVSQPEFSDQIALSTVSSNNQNPAVAASQNGRSVYAVWEGYVGGTRRIILRESYDGAWLSEVIVDANPAGENRNPSVAVDSSGNPHVAWIAKVGGRLRPLYATRLSRFPSRWTLTQITAENEPARGDSDYVTIKIDSTDRPWIAWQTGFGNAYSIHCAFVGPDGAFSVEELTPAATTHNLEPEIFFDPDPSILWYTAREDIFYLVGERYDSQSRQWTDLPLSNLENMRADSLPQLLKSESGRYAGIWYDRLMTANGELSPSDRIFLGIQGPESKGRGAVIDQQADATNRSVSGDVAGSHFVAVWSSDTFEFGPQITAGFGVTPETISTAEVSDGQQLSYANPKVSATGVEGAAIVWESSASDGSGNGNIYFRKMTF